MEGVLMWLDTNKEWMFSGLGVAALLTIFNRSRSAKARRVQTQNSGDDSTNIQAGRDLNIRK